MAIYKNTPPIVTNGLWIFSDFTNPMSYSGTGTVVNDLVKTGNTGSLINSPTFVQDGFTKYLAFNGTNSYLQYPNALSGSNTANWSWGGWVNHGTAVAEDHFFGRGQDGAGAGQNVLVGTNTSRPFVGVVTTVPSTTQISAIDTRTTYLANTWYHVFGTWQAGVALKIYVNGVMKTRTATTTTVLRSSTTGWLVASASTTAFYNNYNAMVMVYNRLLTDQEVLQNYNATKSRFGLR